MATFTLGKGPINVEAAVTDYFNFPPATPLELVPTYIERDRPHFAARPGFRSKHLPLRVEPESGITYCGGHYLFDTFEHAQAFVAWLENDYTVDGTVFVKVPFFQNLACHVWQVVGAHDFTEVSDAHAVIRCLRWRLTDSEHAETLRALWPGLRDTAERQGLASLWLLANAEERHAGVVAVADRAAAPAGASYDYASIQALENREFLNQVLADQAWAEKIYDRTSWVWTVWLPHTVGAEENLAPLWPNSPPLPAVQPIAVPNAVSG